MVMSCGAGDEDMNVWSVREGRLVGCVHATGTHINGVWCMTMYGCTLISGGAEGTIKQWDVEKEECVQTVPPVHTVIMLCGRFVRWVILLSLQESSV